MAVSSRKILKAGRERPRLTLTSASGFMLEKEKALYLPSVVDASPLALL